MKKNKSPFIAFPLHWPYAMHSILSRYFHRHAL